MTQNDLLEAATFSPYMFMQDSAWHGHLPFAAWLMKELKPDVFVELGSHWGHSYFSFCQAVSESKLGTKCFAVDTWQGDGHAGIYGDEVLNHITGHNQANYGAFSRLLRMTFDEASNYFSGPSVDLLHIDGLHTYGAVKHDFDSWLPKLTPGAVVIFHDTNVRERDFGVWKLWDELTKKYPNNIEFTHSHGLGVLQIEGATEAKKLSWLEPGFADHQKIKDYFAALGKRQCERFLLSHAQNDIGHYRREVADRDSRITHLNELLHNRDVSIAELGEPPGQVQGQVALLSALLAERDRELSEVAILTNNHRREIESLRGSLTHQEASRHQLASELDATRLELSALYVSRLVRIAQRISRIRQRLNFSARS